MKASQPFRLKSQLAFSAESIFETRHHSNQKHLKLYTAGIKTPHLPKYIHSHGQDNDNDDHLSLGGRSAAVSGSQRRAAHLRVPRHIAVLGGRTN